MLPHPIKISLFFFLLHFNFMLKTNVKLEKSLTPLYEIVTSGDNSYSTVSDLLENLKDSLNDVNELRNEPIILKIQSKAYRLLYMILLFN